MARLRGLGFALAVLALGATPIGAQTAPVVSPSAASASAASPRASAAAPAVSEPVPVGEITVRSQVAIDAARSLESDLAGQDDSKQLEADLVRLAQRIEPQLKPRTVDLQQTPSIATLSNLTAEWQGYDRQLGSREDHLRRLIASLESQNEELSRSRDLWRRTRAQARERDVPPVILAAVDATLAEIRKASAAVEGSLNDALVLQSQYADLHAGVQQVLASIDATRTRVLDNLLVRDVPPLWDVGGAGLGEWTHWRIGDYLQLLREELPRFVAQHQDVVTLQVLIFALLIWAMRRARAALAGTAPPKDADPEAIGPDEGAQLATRHPVAAATVLTLFLSRFLYGDAPHSVVAALRLVFVPAALVVLRPMLGKAFRPPLYLLTGFALFDRLRSMLTGSTTPDRVAFTAEMIALVVVLALLLRPDRLHNLPASARGNRWLSALGLWIRAGAVGAALAALASVAGYTRFASLVGGGVLGSGYVALALFALVRVAEGLAAALFGGHAVAAIRMVDHHRAMFLRRTRKLLRAAALISWVLFVLGLFAMRAPLFRGLQAMLGSSLGYAGFDVTLGGVLAFVATLFGAWFVARALRFVLDEEIFPRVTLARGVPFALSTLLRYAVLLVGFLMALSALGFDLDRITILLGAFGVGIGFGLQTVVNNFVSGLILLFERPIKVGDMVELAGLEGTVQRIGIRASALRTWDGADVIVPNAALITDRVVNWTLSDRLRRITLAVGVAYGSDPRRVETVLRGVAEKHPGVCAYPKPLILFMRFGESSLDFEVRIWTDNPEMLGTTRSEVAMAIHDALRDAGIEIPFPQRVLHVGSVAPDAAASLRGERSLDQSSRGAAKRAEPEARVAGRSTEDPPE
ncbi:MAG TPA: mechanosensitive ion channel domain-containing protein [Myxococcota bacterium]|nr:mechanosensitive ion channel domain-containing protein [Myxococcota bacterium]